MLRVYRNRNGCGSIIADLVLLYGLGLVLLYLKGIKNPSGGGIIGASILVFIGLIGIGAVAGYIDKVSTGWKRCHHGILRGISQGLCTACVAEKKAIEENYRKQRELEE